jgi:hypothetical protein
MSSTLALGDVVTMPTAFGSKRLSKLAQLRKFDNGMEKFAPS